MRDLALALALGASLATVPLLASGAGYEEQPSSSSASMDASSQSGNDRMDLRGNARTDSSVAGEPARHSAPTDGLSDRNDASKSRVDAAVNSAEGQQ